MSCLHSYGLEALFTFVSISNIDIIPSSFVQGSKLPPGYKRRISHSVDGLLESYGPYKQSPILNVIPVKRKLASGKAGCNKQVCLATFLSMFRVQRGLAVVQQ